ncbi:RNA-binding protein [Candidatus Bathyarchaeota archaeon]|nr:MAG: RNA-binding protein [Candidatus Bathyarchaeota archaeon]
MSKPYRYRLNVRSIKSVVKEVEQRFGVRLSRKASWEALRVDKDREVYVVDGVPMLVRVGDDIYPSILCVERGLVSLPKVVVDMGAVPHIANGADVMLPGVVKVEGVFEEGDIVAVVDERHGRTLAIARSLVSAEEASTLERGRGFKNIHHVGDRFWRAMKTYGFV